MCCVERACGGVRGCCCVKMKEYIVEKKVVSVCVVEEGTLAGRIEGECIERLEKGRRVFFLSEGRETGMI